MRPGPTAYGVPGGDELAPVVGEGLLDGLVAAPAVGRRLAGDVHLLGADLLRELAG